MAISFRRAREAVARIRRHSDQCLIVHYSCQSFYDDREGLSPRIASIVVKNFSNDQTISFAINFTAEQLHIAKADIDSRLDEIETRMLENFYSTVREKVGHLWLHWNMINIQYGFETLAHRYYVLTGKNAPQIDIDNRINIAEILNGLYGHSYVKDPHMENLMLLNWGALKRDFVPGKEEIQLFKQKEYARLHASTVSKVRLFSDITERILDRKLKTEQATLYVRMERWLDHPYAKVVALLAALWTIISIPLLIWK
jgi:hypothetical protein